jgi:Na+/H+ antiporter NhaC
MDTLLLIVVAALVLYIAYLELRLSANPPQTVVVMPSTAEQESGFGCAAIALLVLLIVIALALLGVLPPLR